MLLLSPGRLIIWYPFCDPREKCGRRILTLTHPTERCQPLPRIQSLFTNNKVFSRQRFGLMDSRWVLVAIGDGWIGLKFVESTEFRVKLIFFILK